jgi:hypothetical protein
MHKNNCHDSRYHIRRRLLLVEYISNISIMPDAQLILSPTNNPDVDKDWVLGL